MIKVQANCSNRITDEELQALKGMGIHYLAVNFLSDSTDYDSVMRFIERAAAHDLTVSDAGCPTLQKCPQILLGMPDRDSWIAKYNDFTCTLGRAGIKINYIAWQPYGIFRSHIGIGKHTRGQKAMICDMDEINTRPLSSGREYDETEIWDSFRYFIERTLPVCEKADVRLALHPNDPPVSSVGGIHSLIWNSDCYRKAFQLADNSPYLGMKMCVGCWLENKEFGNLMQDIKEFTEQGKVFIVHFRNVSSTIPYFEETLLEDGYADMYAIIEQFLRCNYDGLINIDHSFFNEDGKKMSQISEAYTLGYMKGLLHSAARNLNISLKPDL